MLDVSSQVGIIHRRPPYLEQIDPRTTLQTKQGLLITVVVVFILQIISLCGIYQYQHSCETFGSAGDDFASFCQYCYGVLVGLLSILVIVTIVMLFQYKKIWMYWVIPPAPRYGQDVEDLVPGILSRNGTELYLQDLNINNQTHLDVERALDSFDTTMKQT